MSVTAKELARLLGLSPAAVSLALNNKPGVSAQTRQLVWDKAKQLGYDFSRNTDRRSGINGTICFLSYRRHGVVMNEHPFFSLLYDGAMTACKNSGFDFIISDMYEDERIAEQIYRMEKAAYAGVIILATEMNELSLQHFSKVQTPIVLLDAFIEGSPFDSILTGNAQGAFLATEHLIRKRRQQPGYLHSSYRISNFDARQAGFRQAIREHGLSPARSIVHLLSPTQEGAYADMKEILQRGEELADCYFADNDLIAAGAMTALQEAGYRIPEDIGIIGFDDIPLGEATTPALSTVHVPKRYLGEMAVSRLVQIISSDQHYPVRLEIATSLKLRKST